MGVKKLLAITLSALICATALSGCKGNGSNSSSGNASSQLVQGLEGSLVVAGAARQFNVSDPDQGGAYQYFHKFYPNFSTTIYDRTNEGGALDQLKQLVAAGTPPDVFITDPTSIKGLVQAGYIYPLDSFLATDQAYAKTLTPMATALNTYNSSVYAIVWESLPRAYMLNLEIFNQLGIAVPSQDWTVDDLLATNKKLIHKDQLISGIQGEQHILTYQFLQAYGAKGEKIVNGHVRACFHEDPNAITAVEKFVELQKQGSDFDQETIKSFGTNWNDYWMKGHVGIVPWSLWGQPYDVATGKNAFKWTALPPPKGPTGKRGASSDAICMAIFPDSNKKDLAWKYIKACTSQHFVENATLLDMTINPPREQPAGFGSDKIVFPTGLPPINVEFVTHPDNQDALKGFVAAASYMKVPDYQIVGLPNNYIMDDCVRQGKSAADCLTRYDNDVNNNLIAAGQ